MASCSMVMGLALLMATATTGTNGSENKKIPPTILDDHIRSLSKVSTIPSYEE